MLARILICGLVGGIAGGVLVAALQAVSTTPLILYAEKFETAQLREGISIVLVHDRQTAAPTTSGFTRLMMTSIATIAVATGYALIVLGAMFLKGREITARSVIPWAVAGFFATGLAPAFGLAPELPGSAAANLGARQIWWLGTAVATATGLAAIAFGRMAAWTAVGVVLIAIPHIIGAPHPEPLSSKVPAEVAAHFASKSLVIQALTWVVPAAIAGFVLAWWTAREQPGTALFG